MVRELGVIIYLSIVRVLFSLFKLLPLKNKTICVASFGDNIAHVIKEMEQQIPSQPVIVLKTPDCKLEFAYNNTRRIYSFTLRRPIDWVSSFYHLATSKNILVDNYYGFLAATPFKDDVQCIQLWHATGAIKRFGLQDASISTRSKQAHLRFQSVYNRFDKVVVGSEAMADIFIMSFGITKRQILRTGIPRTDFFYNEEAMNTTKEELLKELPDAEKKKVILYAPTYRDEELHMHNLHIDIKQMHQQLGDDFILLLRLHPAIVQKPNIYDTDFAFNVSHYHNVNHLLTITDILITDYSSIPFEFALLKKPMIFYAYDWDSYKQARGTYEELESLAPGPIAKNTAEVIEYIQHYTFDLARIQTFSNKWNEYSNGTSSQNLITHLYETTEKPRAQ